MYDITKSTPSRTIMIKKTAKKSFGFLMTKKIKNSPIAIETGIFDWIRAIVLWRISSKIIINTFFALYDIDIMQTFQYQNYRPETAIILSDSQNLGSLPS